MLCACVGEVHNTEIRFNLEADMKASDVLLSTTAVMGGTIIPGLGEFHIFPGIC